MKKIVGNGNRKANGRQITKHHIRPKSRGGNGEEYNIVGIPRAFHEGWHALFGNLMPQEAIQYIQEIFYSPNHKRKRRKKRWTCEELYELQLKIQMETHARERKQGRTST